VLTSVMPTCLSSTAGPPLASSLASTAAVPRARLAPWSASPMAESSRVSSSACSAIDAANARTQRSSAAASIGRGPAGSASVMSAPRGAERVGGHAPHRSPGVRTGASHRRVSSSSIRAG
jgi:hypothetical protein